MEAWFAANARHIYTNTNHHGYLLRWKLLAPFCKNWSYNREPDTARVAEMLEYHNRGGYLPLTIYLAEHAKDGLVCYDGNHRREVFNAATQDVGCIVDVIFNATHPVICDAFNNINKAVSVPAIYPAPAEYPKEEILRLVRKYEQGYPVFISTSARYHAPNFNRDVFTSMISDIYDSFSGTVSIPEIETLLEKLNEEYAAGRLCRPHSSYKPAVIEKCQKNRFWLFLERSISIEHIHRVHQTLFVHP